MKVLLDTNAYTAFVSDRGGVPRRVRDSEGVVFSGIVLGELLFGFRNGTRYEWNRTRLDSFLAHRHVAVAPVTLITAERFGLIATDLRKVGTPIPSNDIWIAAHAMETGARLLSFDAHFDKIPGLLWTHLGVD